MSIFKHMFCATFLCASSLVFASEPAITIDGATADWAAIAPLATATGQNANSIKSVISGNNLYIVIEGQNLSSNYNLFLDADGNAATGYQAGYWTSSGAEYLLSNGVLHRNTGAGWVWSHVAGDVTVTATPSVIEIRIALASLNVGIPPASMPMNIGLGFQSLTSAWALSSKLPASSSFANLSTSVPTSFPVGKGMIIPAYLSLDDAFSWNILKEGAALMQAGSNQSYKDYWITVNSSVNGPFTEAADWSKAATVWNPIRANGGRIFGYIHTCVEPVGPHYRNLDTLKAEITAWVNGYPQLDGIWLDEFYPRFELADTDGLAGPNYPNGINLAPTDRSFVNSLGQFNGVQVQPAGGFYDQLISWIRQTYPKLRIIGNAGGDFYSNQLNYGNLVDVLVSFEQNLDTASHNPVNDWAGLIRQNPNTTSGQLALIHRNSVNLSGAVDQAFSHGYSHIYTTDRLLENNIWGGLPPYLMSEIQYIADHP